MESMNEISDSQTLSQQLAVEATDFIGIGHSATDNESDCGVSDAKKMVNKMKYVKSQMDSQSPGANSNSMQSLTATRGSGRLREDEDSSSVVIGIDEMGNTNLQTPYQIVPRQLHANRSLPLSLVPIHQERHDRLVVNSPLEFEGSEISLDGLSVNTASQIIAVKHEHKLVIVNSEQSENTDTTDHVNDIARRRSPPRLDINMSNINVSVIDELSSDGGIEEITLNQHHQQLLDQQQHQLHRGQQYTHRHNAASDVSHHQEQYHRQQQRNIQITIGGHEHHGNHREALSVIVHSQEDEEELDDEDDVDDSAGQLLSPALAVENSLEHSTYQTLTSVSNRISEQDFCPTSYATLTPIQPLPPISTMSEKFAYVGRISGSTSSSGSVNSSIVATNGRGSTCVVPCSTSDNTVTHCGSFTNLPLSIEGPHQSSLGNLGLSGLAGVQSPYSSYDKLPSLISPTTQNFTGSPSHGLSGMVGACDLHNHPSEVPSPLPGSIPGGCDTLSPHSEMRSQSPQLQVNVNLNIHKTAVSTSQSQIQCHRIGQEHGHNQSGQALQLDPVTLHKQVICLSSPCGIPDGVIVSDYESSYHKYHSNHELIMATSSTTNSTGGRTSQLRLEHSPTLSPHSVSAGSVVSMSLHSPVSGIALSHMNGSVGNLAVELPVVVSLSPTSPSGNNTIAMEINENALRQRQEQHPQNLLQTSAKIQQNDNESIPNTDQRLTNIACNNSQDVCNISQHQESVQQNGFVAEPLTSKTSPMSPKIAGVATVTPLPGNSVSNLGVNHRSSGGNDAEEINTKELAQRISAELKRYSIPQAIFAQRVLCRSQGTLSDLLRNPKPWSKLKSGRETFRRMFKWLQEPEFQRMSALRMAAAQIPQRPSTGAPPGGSSSLNNVVFASGSTSNTASVLSNTTSEVLPGSIASGNAIISRSASSGAGPGTNCRRKEEPHIEQMPQPKKPRLVFTDLQRRTLQAIFKETKRPSKEMQVTIARQLGLEPTTVGNFFMNARRRSMDKWRDDDSKNTQHSLSMQRQQDESEERENNEGAAHGHYNNIHTTAMSPLGDFDDEGEMDLELDHRDFLVDDNDGDGHDDML